MCQPSLSHKASYRVAAAVASSAAAAAAVLLWGVGSEAVYFGDRLHGCLLLASALVVTLLECLTVWGYVDWRLARSWDQRHQPICRPSPSLLAMLDTHKRSVVYCGLTVPCFAAAAAGHRGWLPLLPGAALLLSAGLYALKSYFDLRVQRDMVRVSSFVRFKGESGSADCCPQDSQQPQQEPEKEQQSRQLTHQLSFTSSHSSGCSNQQQPQQQQHLGSKDSGIEASQRDVPAAATAAASDAEASAAAAAAVKKPRGLSRAISSSPDRCCLINEDNLSLPE